MASDWILRTMPRGRKTRPREEGREGGRVGINGLAGLEGGISPLSIVLQGVLDNGVRLDLKDDAQGKKDQA